MGKCKERAVILNSYRCRQKRTRTGTGAVVCQSSVGDRDKEICVELLQHCDRTIVSVPVTFRQAQGSQSSDAKQFLNNRLSKGQALGNVVFKSSNGVQFKCTKDCIGGRGLRVHQSVPKGVTIARGNGRIVHSSDADFNMICMSNEFKLWDSQYTVLQLYPPTIECPANLANTSNGNSKNNCRIKHRSGSDYFSIETVTALRAGEEVTVAYGSKFTKHVRSAATIAAELDNIAKKEKRSIMNSYVHCDKCNVLIVHRRLARHRGRIGCLQRQRALNL